MTKQDVEALADLTREQLLARGLTGDQADALLALDRQTRRRTLLEAFWDAGGGAAAAVTVLHESARVETDNVGGLHRQRSKYPYVSMRLKGTAAARDCPHQAVTVGRQKRRTVMAPVVLSRAHERELMAKHLLQRE